jgi:hypothetical protein
MKDSRIYLVLSAIYLAPNVTKTFGIAMGVYLAVCMFYAMWKES